MSPLLPIASASSAPSRFTLKDVPETISTHKGDLTLTEEQREAVLALANSEDRFCVLTGLAGTGKTTVMMALADMLESAGYTVILVAPTGKAAVVLSAKTGRKATTVHRLLYTQVYEDVATGELEFEGDKEEIRDRAVVIVDEASMIGRKIHKDIEIRMPVRARCIYVGDPGQLPPVGDSWGPDFDNPAAHLETIHRQAAGSPIITAAHYVRNSDKAEPPWTSAPDGRYRYMHVSMWDAVGWLERRVRISIENQEPLDAVFLTFRRKVRARINGAVRQRLGFKNKPPQIGESVRVCSNNYEHEVTNGEILQVVEEGVLRKSPGKAAVIIGMVLRAADGRTYTVKTTAIGKDRKSFEEAARSCGAPWMIHRSPWLHLDYGYASTTHSAQGSEWPFVVVHSDPVMEYVYKKPDKRTGQPRLDDQRRWYYTAITRAASKCVIVTFTEKL